MYGASAPLKKVSITSPTASVTFTDIPQTYRDLYIVLNGGMTSRGNPSITIPSQAWSMSGGKYNIGGTTYDVVSSVNDNLTLHVNYWTTTNSGFMEISIFNYSNANNDLALVMSASAAGSATSGDITGMSIGTGLTTKNAGTTQLTITGPFTAGTELKMWGIKA